MTAKSRVSSFVSLHHYVTKTTTTAATLIAVIIKKKDIYLKYELKSNRVYTFYNA